MHLVVFPIFLYLIVAAPILLTWPQRGLSSRNYWIAVGALFLGQVVGLIFSGFMSNVLNVAIAVSFSFTLAPLLSLMLFVYKFGNTGSSFARSNSTLIILPKEAVFALVVSTIISLIASVSFAIAWGIGETEIYLGLSVFIPREWYNNNSKQYL